MSEETLKPVILVSAIVEVGNTAVFLNRGILNHWHGTAYPIIGTDKDIDESAGIPASVDQIKQALEELRNGANRVSFE